jgi:hypothetical protein
MQKLVLLSRDFVIATTFWESYYSPNFHFPAYHFPESHFLADHFPVNQNPGNLTRGNGLTRKRSYGETYRILHFIYFLETLSTGIFFHSNLNVSALNFNDVILDFCFFILEDSFCLAFNYLTQLILKWLLFFATVYFDKYHRCKWLACLTRSMLSNST